MPDPEITTRERWLAARREPDLTARGRPEDWEQPPGRGDDPALSWLRRRDEYEPGVIGGASTPR